MCIRDRINLCKALLADPNMLLLDEPTNYLDILSLRWLKEYLNKWPGEMILITHDRDFMDKVTTHTLGLHRKKTKKVKGDTIKFYEMIIQEEETYEQTRKNLENKRKEMQLLVDRFRAKASKASLFISKSLPCGPFWSSRRTEGRKSFKRCPVRHFGAISMLSTAASSKASL